MEVAEATLPVSIAVLILSEVATQNASRRDLPLVLLLAACQVMPPPIAPSPQAEPPASASLELLHQERGLKGCHQLMAALEAAVASSDTNWLGAILHVRARSGRLGDQ